ncbi:hypothetical protein [Catenuloplanes atrovinosus]|uniref:Uncharacterized protein n=1 Tax=Catenuloplanes atrovinosus TaxID=137266 RepID=A0AAE4CC37_9ACTN|nr:hypothetical protein [Catenuloplanes atrovinosus]MDR7279251.1 hypothetical protein [Catenuloplanes atrovinosus]
MLIRLAAEGPRGAVPLFGTLAGTAGQPWWTRRPALATMLPGELWDFHTHAAIAAWLEKSGRDAGSPACSGSVSARRRATPL